MTKKILNQINNQDGSMLLIVIIVLIAATLLGIFATNTTNIEIQIAGNDKFSKMVFNAADAGISYVASVPSLYGPNNTTLDNSLPFPAPPAITYSLSNQLEVSGDITYKGKSQLPAGSGYSAGTFLAIKYEIESNGAGPKNGASTINAGFYRIGL